MHEGQDRRVHLPGFTPTMSAEAAPAVVPETLLKKRKRDEQWAAAKSAELSAAKTRNAKNRTLIFKRAQQYQEEYEKQVRWPCEWTRFFLSLLDNSRP